MPGRLSGATSKSAGRASSRTKNAPDSGRHGKRVTFDAETWQAVDLLAHDSLKDFQELADEAFRDLLAKHGRPTDLKTALKRSAARKSSNVKQTSRPA